MPAKASRRKTRWIRYRLSEAEYADIAAAALLDAKEIGQELEKRQLGHGLTFSADEWSRNVTIYLARARLGKT